MLRAGTFKKEKVSLINTAPEVGENLSKSLLAKKLGVSRSSLYYKPKLSEKDEELRKEIEKIMASHPAYGHRRISIALKSNKKRILRVMKKFHLKPARRSKTPKKPADQGQARRKYPCVTKLWSPIEPNILLTGDFSFICYRGRFIYLSVVQDRYTAYIHGARVMFHHSKELIYQTILDAFESAGEFPEWFHSDLGSEYESGDVIDLVESNGINISRAPKGSPWWNAAQESFFGRFKVEFGDPDRFETVEELISAIYQHLAYYNYDRIHTRLKMTPKEFLEVCKKRSKKISPQPPLKQLATSSTALTVSNKSNCCGFIDNCPHPVDMPTAWEFF